MARKEIHRVQSTSYHRNGVGGAPFGVVLFNSTDDPGRTMLGVVFAGKYETAVLDVGLLAEGEIRFAYNSFRGDNFDAELREALNATGCGVDLEAEDEDEEVYFTVELMLPQTARMTVLARDEAEAEQKALELAYDDDAPLNFDPAKWEVTGVEEGEA